MPCITKKFVKINMKYDINNSVSEHLFITKANEHENTPLKDMDFKKGDTASYSSRSKCSSTLCQNSLPAFLNERIFSCGSPESRLSLTQLPQSNDCCLISENENVLDSSDFYQNLTLSSKKSNRFIIRIPFSSRYVGCIPPVITTF